jgi:uncharacterized membrane protein YfcA
MDVGSSAWLFGSAAAFLRAGLTNIRIAIVLETATTLGALTGVFLGGVTAAPRALEAAPLAFFCCGCY